MIKLKIRKIDKSKIIVFCSFSIILLSFFFISYNLYSKYKNEKNNDLQIKEYFEIQETINNNQEIKQEEKQNNTQKKEDYFAILEIPKINLFRGFYNINSRLNNVNKNIQILKESTMPNVNNSNLILVAHSGNSKVSFFKNLYKLSIDDTAIIYYENNTYNYNLIDIYEIEKNGTFTITQNNSDTLTLITCKPKTNKQIVFVFKLKK